MSSLSFTDPRFGIMLTDSKTYRFADPIEIIYLKADTNYTHIHLADNKVYIESKTLKIFEDKLDKYLFFRCHKSCMINIGYIKELESSDKGGFIHLKNGTSLPVARRRISNLRKRLKGK